MEKKKTNAKVKSKKVKKVYGELGVKRIVTRGPVSEVIVEIADKDSELCNEVVNVTRYSTTEQICVMSKNKIIATVLIKRSNKK